MDADDLERMAVEALLSDAKRATELEKTLGTTAWRKRTTDQVNKRFIQHLVRNTLTTDHVGSSTQSEHKSAHSDRRSGDERDTDKRHGSRGKESSSSSRDASHDRSRDRLSSRQLARMERSSETYRRLHGYRPQERATGDKKRYDSESRSQIQIRLRKSPDVDKRSKSSEGNDRAATKRSGERHSDNPKHRKLESKKA